jgi:heme exporter protein A
VTEASFSLELSDFGLSRGGHPLFSGLRLTLKPGQLALLMGPNGSGKSSLLRAIAGLAVADEGHIALNGRPAAAPELQQSVAYLSHVDGLKKDLSVLENLRFISQLRNSSHKIQELISAVGLTALAGRAVRQLSAGQKRRVALAALRTSNARLWLLDEPMTNLDGPGRELLGHWLDEHLATGGIAIAATHRVDELRRTGCLLVEL